MSIGIILVAIGLLFFAQTLGLVTAETMQVVWPLSLVIMGVVLISHKVLGHDCVGGGCWCGGTIDFGNGKKGGKKRKR